MALHRPIGMTIRQAAWLAALAIAVITLLATGAPLARAGGAQVLYGADGAGGNPSNLYILNPATGAVVSTVGPIGFAVTGLAVHPTTGVLYGTTANRSPVSPGFLISINTTTGAGTPIGDLVPATETAADITFGADGTLYGWLEAGTDDLITINLMTGAATVVGDSGLSTAGAGLAGSGNPVVLGGEGDAGCLSLIDTGTGAATAPCVVTANGTTFGGELAALDYDAGGVLYGADLTDAGGSNPRPAQLITINTLTGAVTVIGDTVEALDAIAFGLAAPPSASPLPDAATSQPSGPPNLGGSLWVLGLVLVIAGAGLGIARSNGVIGRR
jgi:hypothetical protein